MLAAFLGTLPGWITSVSVVGMLGIMVRGYLGKGRLAIDAKQVNVTAEGKLREHYANELGSLREQIIKMGQHHLDREREIDERWRKLLQESEQRHEECVAQREQLAKEVREVKERQLAQVRQFTAYQRSIIDLLPESMKTPQLMAALETLELGDHTA